MMDIRLQPHNDVESNRKFVVRVYSRRTRRAFFTIVACCFLLSTSPRAFSQKEEGAEYTIKLAFLYNFTKFVEWPPDS